MPHEQHRFTALIQRLENDLLLAEVLFFPELSRLHNKGKPLVKALRTNIVRLLKSLDRIDITRRHPPLEPEIRKVSLELESPIRTCHWREVVHLELSIIVWCHEQETWLAYVPALGIEVPAPSEEERDELVLAHAKAALMRNRQLSLAALANLDRGKSFTLHKIGCSLLLPSPRQLVQRNLEEEQKEESVLKEVATNLTVGSLPEAHESQDLLHGIVDALTDRRRQSVLLVGPSGVGKTALIHEVVRRRKELGLADVPFWATSGSRLVAGMTGFGMWQERCQKLCKEAQRRNAVLHVGNLMELMEVGKSANQAQGIASFLRPYIVRGDITVLTECTAEQKTIIERLEPQLFHGPLVEVEVPEPDHDRGLAILTSEALAMVIQRADQAPCLPISNEAVARLDALHRRYATYSAYPGRPLRFLRNLIADQPPETTATPSDVTLAFSRETGLPLFLLSESEPLDLARARQWFSQRVIGQEEAVELIVNLMATIKAQLTRPRKPIASLMFIGPTGVGKTEMAKALAEFLFGSRDRLTRFDMSEYADLFAVQRLIGGLGSKEGLLTAKVREQPFSVVLLDEIEKAHSQFFDLLLQVLGEGRLTDGCGRVADFSNSLVIMTSNLGAASYQKGAIGFRSLTAQESEAPEIMKRESREHFEREVQQKVRPELFNRIDRIVPFGPLSQEVILQITARQLETLQAREGIRFRGVDLNIESEVHRWLAERGFDARYGARPLKRAIEKEMLAPLSERMNSYTVETPLRASVGLEDGKLSISVRAQTDAAGKLAEAQGSTMIEHLKSLVNLRRNTQRLEQCSAVLEIMNEIFLLEWTERRINRRKESQVTAMESQELARLAQLRKTREVIVQLRDDISACENAHLTELHLQQQVSLNLTETLLPLRQRWHALLRSLYLRQFDKPNEVTLCIFGEPLSRLLELALAYCQIAEGRGGQVEVWQFIPSGEKRDRTTTLKRRQILEPTYRLNATRLRARECISFGQGLTLDPEEVQIPGLQGTIGLALMIKAPAALPLYSTEAGTHQFNAAHDAGRCLVDISEMPMIGTEPEKFYQPPQGVERKGSIGPEPRRRLYAPDRGEVEDALLRRKLVLDPDHLSDFLAEQMDEQLNVNAEKLLNQ